MQTPTPEHISAITSQHHGRVSRDMARSFLSGLAEGTTPKEAAKLFNSELGKKHGRTSEWQAERANVNAKVRAITARHGGRVSRQTAEEFIMAHPEP